MIRLVYHGVAVLGSLNRHDTFMYVKTWNLCYFEPDDGLSMHNRLGEKAPHTYNQPMGCIVDTWWL